jgi:hypothetical protein
MPPEEALSRMANVTQMIGGLRVRMEGLTLVIWAICMAASYLTIAVPIVGGRAPGRRPPFNGTFNGSFNGTFNGTGPGPRGPPPTEFFNSAFAPLVWFAIAAVVTIVLWRAMSLSLQTGVSTPRLVLVLFGWLIIFVVVTVLLTFVEGGNPRAWHLTAWALVLGLFAALNPLRFSKRSRWAVAVVVLVVAASSVYALTADLDPRDTTFLSGLVIGLPTLLAGLYVMLTG